MLFRVGEVREKCDSVGFGIVKAYQNYTGSVAKPIFDPYMDGQRWLACYEVLSDTLGYGSIATWPCLCVFVCVYIFCIPSINFRRGFSNLEFESKLLL